MSVGARQIYFLIQQTFTEDLMCSMLSAADTTIRTDMISTPTKLSVGEADIYQMKPSLPSWLRRQTTNQCSIWRSWQWGGHAVGLFSAYPSMRSQVVMGRCWGKGRGKYYQQRSRVCTGLAVRKQGELVTVEPGQCGKNAKSQGRGRRNVLKWGWRNKNL